jgi:error-prone DNA polymerase
VAPNEAELATLAEIGALANVGGESGKGRRSALWQVSALGRSGALFSRVATADSSPLAEMTTDEEMRADFRGTSLSTGPHPLSFLRARLDREGILSAAALAKAHDGAHVRTAGIVIVRQRPGTAKGFVFVTLEDETGFSNALVTPDQYQRWRPVLLGHGALVIEGKVQNREGVVLLAAERFQPLTGTNLEDRDMSRDFR